MALILCLSSCKKEEEEQLGAVRLNFMNDAGEPLANTDIRVQSYIQSGSGWESNWGTSQTDASGNLEVPRLTSKVYYFADSTHYAVAGLQEGELTRLKSKTVIAYPRHAFGIRFYDTIPGRQLAALIVTEDPFGTSIPDHNRIQIDTLDQIYTPIDTVMYFDIHSANCVFSWSVKSNGGSTVESNTEFILIDHDDSQYQIGPF